MAVSIGGVVGLWWRHIEQCKVVRADLAMVLERLKKLDVFDEWFRERDRMGLPHRMEAAEKDLQGLRDWKHIVVDPLIPRAVEEHERRLNRLDQRMDER
jgi:hypothetical protein